MARSILQDLCLEVRQEVPETTAVLDQLLQDLFCVRTQAGARPPDLRLMVHQPAQGCCHPPLARAVFRAEEFCGLEQDDEFYLTAGASLLHLQARHGQGAVYLVPAFWHTPLPLQRIFRVFGLLKLLRPRGVYSLHAAGLVTPAGRGVLIVGPSGSSKSTLTMGLVRQVWQYLSDDAVLLRQHATGVTALAFRTPCYVDTSAAATYADLPWGAAVPDRLGRSRQHLRLADSYPGCAIRHCLPQVLFFASIVPESHSTVCPSTA
jgi:hypothetical protein